MKINELHNQPVKPDTYEASMALNQLLKIGKHAIKIHNMIDDAAEMESWVAKKIDLAGDYVKKVHGYMQGEKAGLYDDGGMTESREQIGDYAREIKSGRIVRIVDFTPDEDGDIYTISYGEDQGENDVFAKDLKFLDQTGSDQEEIGKFDEDAGSLTDQQKKALDMVQAKYGNRVGGNGDSLPKGYMLMRLQTGVGTDGIDDDELEAALKKYGYDSMYDAEQADDDFFDKIHNKEHLPITMNMIDALSDAMGSDFMDDKKLGDAYDYLYNRDESVSEDAGEGHMSKSTLYHTAKYAIELMDMINKGDDLEGWVQSKLNKAADYLQGVHNYEEYQKLNPYREELDSSVLQRHAGIVQKNIDEILARETSLDDVDTKPGMMRILAKRVNEVEKKMAKENRKNTDEAHGGQHSTSGRSMTKGEMNKREKIVKGMKKNKAGFKKRYGKDAEAVMYATATKNAMKDDEANESGILYRAGVKKYGKAGMKAIQSAAGKGASHQEIGKIKDKHLKDDEQMQEGIKDWAKNLAMAGVIVAGLAGVGSIQDAIDRSVPAVAAMEKALELAQDQGNDELANMIEKDLSAVKVRLSSGKDLNFVKSMQSKYSKFIQTEGLAYESKLAIRLEQQIK